MTRRLSRLLLYTVAGLLLLLALGLSTLRLMVAHVGDYRQQVERAVSDYLGQPVRIGGLDARLLGLSPALVLDDLTLLSPDEDTPLATFAHLGITLDLPASLLRRAPVVQIVLGGANITVRRQPDGRLTIQGLADTDTDTTTTREGDALPGWLLGMPRLSIRDSHLHWQDRPGGETWHFTVPHLLLENLPGQHRIKGSLGMPGEVGKQLQLALELEGDPTVPADWHARFYLQLQQLQAAARAGRYRFGDWTLEGGALDLALWGEWRERQLALLEGNIQLADLQLAADDHTTRRLAHLAANLHFQQAEDLWNLQLDEVRIRHAGEAVEPMRIAVRQHDERLRIQADRLAIEQLLPLADLLPWLDDSQRQAISALAPSGGIEDLHLVFDNQRLQAATAVLQQVGIRPWQRIPGISGLSARLDYDHDRTRLALDSTALSVNLPWLFRKPLALHHTRGQIQLAHETDGWRLFGQGIEVDSPDIQVQGDVQMLFDDQPTPLLSIRGQFQNGMAAAVRDYLPVTLLPDNALAWLERAFLTGRAESGQILLHGRAGDFPYRHAEGHFEVLFEARDVMLDYAPEWPVIHAVDGEVRFDNTGMHILAAHGRLFDARIGHTRATIRDFAQARLEIDGSASASAAAGLRFLRESPLGRDMNALHDFQANGDARLQLQLTLPLASSLAHQAPHITGKVEFHDSELQVHEALPFTRINGALHFDRNRFTARDIQAELHAQPLTVDVISQSSQGNGELQTVVHARGKLDPHTLTQHWQTHPWLDRLDGETRWQGQLHIPHTGEAPPVLSLQSALQGVASRLPVPLAKQADEALDISVLLHLGHAPAWTNHLIVRDRLALRWQEDGEGQLARAALAFGADTSSTPPDDAAIEIRGTQQDLDIGAWQSLLSLEQGAERTATRALPIRIHMQSLHLIAPSAAEAPGSSATLRRWNRSVDLHIRDLRYNATPLGETRARLVPDAGQLLLEDLSVTTPTFRISGHGRWQYQPQRSYAQLSLDSPDTGRMLRDLGYASVIRKGRLDATAQLSWPGGPLGFSLARLNGQMTARIVEGTLEDARPGAGKLLGILSLEALPRRLMLDFRDVAEKGLQFKTIDGSFEVHSGNLYSKELLIDSYPAQILITGRTGLVAQDFDHEMYVIPQVRDTISIAGALTMGPQVGALLVLLQNLFKKGIDEATMRRYHITGSWEDPHITPINPPSAEP